MLKKTANNIASKKYLLVSHYATYAMQDLLYEYLTNKKSVLVKKINFPLPELPFLKRIEVEENRKGKVMKKIFDFSITSPIPFAYFIHFLQLLWLGVTDDNTFDVIIAQNSLLAIASLLLKKIGKIKKVIFYSHGVAGSRFSKSPMNTLYQWMDRFAAQHSNLNWLLSKEMIAVRVKQGIAGDTIFWVPTALQLGKVKRSNVSLKKSLLFLGTLNEMNGVLLLPGILEKVKKRFPEYSMDIIGDGPLKGKMIDEFKKLHLLSSVNVLGIQRFNDYRETLTAHVVGLAPYLPSSSNLLQATDPMKVRLYMMAGLPTVTTKGFPFSKEIVENDLGFTVEYASQAYASAIISLLIDGKKNRKMRQNNLQYSIQFDQENIFTKPLEKLFHE